jgi:hypothetical protein
MYGKYRIIEITNKNDGDVSYEVQSLFDYYPFNWLVGGPKWEVCTDFDGFIQRFKKLKHAEEYIEEQRPKRYSKKVIKTVTYTIEQI